MRQREKGVKVKAGDSDLSHWFPFAPVGSGQVCRWEEPESGSGRERYEMLVRCPSRDAEEAGDTGAWSSWAGPGCRE